MATLAYPSPSRSMSITPPPPTTLPFALVQLKGAVCLVQLDPAMVSSPLMCSDLRVYRHEFITIFRYSHSTSVHPSDFHLLEVLDNHSLTFQEDQETVYLPRDLMDRIQRFSRAGSGMGSTSPYSRYIPTSSMSGHPKRIQKARTPRVARIH